MAFAKFGYTIYICRILRKDMCEKYLYSTITFGNNVRHQRLHIDCKVTDEYDGHEWKQKI